MCIEGLLLQKINVYEWDVHGRRARWEFFRATTTTTCARTTYIWGSLHCIIIRETTYNHDLQQLIICVPMDANSNKVRRGDAVIAELCVSTYIGKYVQLRSSCYAPLHPDSSRPVGGTTTSNPSFEGVYFKK